jgi:hypothetical protein
VLVCKHGIWTGWMIIESNCVHWDWDIPTTLLYLQHVLGHYEVEYKTGRSTKSLQIWKLKKKKKKKVYRLRVKLCCMIKSGVFM